MPEGPFKNGIKSWFMLPLSGSCSYKKPKYQRFKVQMYENLKLYGKVEYFLVHTYQNVQRMLTYYIYLVILIMFELKQMNINLMCL